MGQEQQQNTNQSSAPAEEISEKKKPTALQDTKKKQNNTSIFFLIWSILSALVLVVSILFGVAQQVVMTQSYRSVAARELTEKGRVIDEQVLKVPSASFGGN